MARPIKKGLDYFPQDCDTYYDRKVRRLMSKYGAEGFLVYHYIKTECYRANGYWMTYDDDLCFDIADFFKFPDITEQSVKDILEHCMQADLFDEKLFREAKVITSFDIQKRYAEVKRAPLIREDIWLLPPLLQQNDAITPENDAVTPENDAVTPAKQALSTQRKEKEIKENKTKEKETKEDETKQNEIKRNETKAEEIKRPRILTKQLLQPWESPSSPGFQDIRDLKTAVLMDSFFIDTITATGLKRHFLDGWLDAFNNKLTFENKTQKLESDYRTHFARWLCKIPGYDTANPADYKPIRDAMPLPEQKPINTGDEKIKKLLRK